MTLRTLDEARASVARSALRLLQRCDSTDPQMIAAMLQGADIDTISARDRMLTSRHRRILNEVAALGYAGEADDELNGVSTAVRL